MNEIQYNIQCHICGRQLVFNSYFTSLYCPVHENSVKLPTSDLYNLSCPTCKSPLLYLNPLVSASKSPRLTCSNPYCPEYSVSPSSKGIGVYYNPYKNFRFEIFEALGARKISYWSISSEGSVFNFVDRSFHLFNIIILAAKVHNYLKDYMTEYYNNYILNNSLVLNI